MCLSPTPNLADATRRAACRVDDQPSDETAQIEAAVEAVGEASEVGVGMLGPAQRVMRAVQAGLEVAKDRLAPGMLATEVSVIDLYSARELVAGIPCGHGVVDLVVRRTGGGVAHTELALERQRGQSGLGLADEVDRQEPSAQRQLGVLHQAPGGQRGLVTAALALKEPACTMADDVVLGAITARAAKSLGPAGGPPASE